MPRRGRPISRSPSAARVGSIDRLRCRKGLLPTCKINSSRRLFIIATWVRSDDPSGSEQWEKRRIGLLVVTHGGLAEELVAAARKIIGEIDSLGAVSIDWDDDAGEAARRIEQGIRDVERETGVLILTDMFGGTPTNLALSQHDGGEVEVITGVNLPMLVKYANLRGQPTLSAAAEGVAEQGREAIQVASELLGRSSAESDE